ncbi:MAG: hypothetical protein P4L51_01065 [Puia sp.]|nr:hypothetical protein [Puia sp.]
MRFVFATILLLKAGFSLYAQNLTGQWTGRSLSRTTDDQQRLVLDISATDSLFGGVMHWYDPGTQDFRHRVVSGHFHGDSLVSIVENNTKKGNIDAASTGSPAGSTYSGGGSDKDPLSGNSEADASLSAGPGVYTLHYKRVGHKEVLEGHWRGASPDHPGEVVSMSIRLERKLGPLIPPIVIPKHHKMDSAQQKQFLAVLSRESPVAATISVLHQDSVELELYDNGAIDGDSVSLYMNGQLVLEHLKLDSKPKIITLALDKTLSVNKLILFAENLGSLPPNTALMEVNTRDKKYNVFLSTDFRKNAMVEFALTE